MSNVVEAHTQEFLARLIKHSRKSDDWEVIAFDDPVETSEILLNYHLIELSFRVQIQKILLEVAPQMLESGVAHSRFSKIVRAEKT